MQAHRHGAFLVSLTVISLDKLISWPSGADVGRKYYFGLLDSGPAPASALKQAGLWNVA